MQDHFKDKAEVWDFNSVQIQGAKTIADAITEKIKLSSQMEILDFGAGTGLLGFEVAKHVKQVYGVDTSMSMLEKLKEKNTPELNIKSYCQDIVKEPLKKSFHGVISSMTLHHVEDLKAFFETIYKNIKSGGFLAIADLELEDGSFHSDNKGVFHLGFDESQLKEVVQNAGFLDIEFENINTINKPHRNFGIFLLTARK